MLAGTEGGTEFVIGPLQSAVETVIHIRVLHTVLLQLSPSCPKSTSSPPMDSPTTFYFILGSEDQLEDGPTTEEPPDYSQDYSPNPGHHSPSPGHSSPNPGHTSSNPGSPNPGHTSPDSGHMSPNPGYLSPNRGPPSPYANRRTRGGVICEHRYALRDMNGRDWLSFKVQSRATDPEHMPLFLEGDTIKGEVCLDLAKPATLKGLTITVRRQVDLRLSNSLASSRCATAPDLRGDNCSGSGGRALSRQDRAGLDPRVASRSQVHRRTHTRVQHRHPTRRVGGTSAKSDANTFSASADVLRACEPHLH